MDREPSKLNFSRSRPSGARRLRSKLWPRSAARTTRSSARAFGGISRSGLLEHRDDRMESHQNLMFSRSRPSGAHRLGSKLWPGSAAKLIVREHVGGISRTGLLEHTDNRMVSGQRSIFSRSRPSGARTLRCKLWREHGQSNARS